MSKRFCSILLVSILVRSIQLASGAEIPPLIDRPNADSGPTEISVGMWMADISSIDSAQETFTAEIAVVLRWKDSRLVHTGIGVVRYPLEQIWHPRVGIVNETNSVSRKMPDSVEVDPDGMITYRQRYVGAFTQPLRLQSFPFDRQTFRGSVSVPRSNVRPGSGLASRRDQGRRRDLAICYPARLDHRKMGAEAARLRAGTAPSVFELRL